MKNKTLSIILFSISVLLLIAFCILLCLDYGIYNETFSAPFSVYVMFRAVEFLLPAVVALCIGLILRKNRHKKESQ